ncbi:39S ribosomal protein L33, mitochondrial [Mobula hypostoma]|uniref:39S ribosomal protein L33, mitochondrial n=1 Tax=Mobula hypostoma TaxID=723540 RepID=UPI002FC33EEB
MAALVKKYGISFLTTSNKSLRNKQYPEAVDKVDELYIIFHASPHQEDTKWRYGRDRARKGQRAKRNVAKSKSKSILVQMVSAAGTGYCFNAKRSRLRDKLVLRKHDPRVNKHVLFFEKKKIRSI